METRGWWRRGGGRLPGLARFRALARPLSASTGGFLDDLFVDPARAGRGLRRGRTVIRGITAEDNDRARGLYDPLAQRTKWVTCNIKL